MARLDIDAAFDTTGALRAPPARALLRELWALQFYAPPRPDPRTLPNGKGKPVMVIPAFLTGDSYTRGLRDYLTQCGFQSFGAAIGPNWGPTAHILSSLRSRFREIRNAASAPVALVGISLGGLLARDLAFDFPGEISHVATIASPISLPTASHLKPLISLCAHAYSSDLKFARLAQPLPVPWTSIYSKRDGLIAWQSCLCDAPGGLCFEVDAPHIAMARNPQALSALITRLAEHSS